MSERESSGAPYPIRAVDRVCDLLDVLRRSDGVVSLTRLAEEVSVPKSSVLRYVSALEARHYVERDRADGGYRLGTAFRPERSQLIDELRERSLPHLLRLRDRFDETVNLGILDGDDVVHVEVAECTRAVRLAARRGERGPLHSTAIGKAIATLLSEDSLRALLDSAGMPAITADTITTPDQFLAEVAVTAERGYALDDCENQPDGRCVAVPIDGLPVPAAVSVSAPASRFAAEDARRIAHQLGKHLSTLVSALRASSL